MRDIFQEKYVYKSLIKMYDNSSLNKLGEGRFYYKSKKTI